MADILMILIGLFSCCVSIESIILDHCSQWNSSAEEIIFGKKYMSGSHPGERLLNLSQSFLHINNETNIITILDDNNRRIIRFNRSNTSNVTEILLDSTNPGAVNNDKAVTMADGPNNTFYILDSSRSKLSIIEQQFVYGSRPSVEMNCSSTSKILLVDKIDGTVYLHYGNVLKIYQCQQNNNWTNHVCTMSLNLDRVVWNQTLSIVMDENRRLFINDFGNNQIQMVEYNSTNFTTLTFVTNPLSLSLPRRNILLITRNTSIILYNLTDGHQHCIIGCDSTSKLQNIHQALLDLDGNLIITVKNEIRSYPMYRQCPSSSMAFLPLNLCPAGRFGNGCAFVDDVCNISRPCQNNGHCTTNATIQRGYSCSCPWGFIGDDCDIDQRPCKSNTCRNQGICRNLSMTQFLCECQQGYEGEQCDRLIDLCKNIVCQNGGICFQRLFKSSCQCLPGFQGQACEISESTQIARIYAVKSLGYIAITTLSLLFIFTITMDILKYFFHIDPVKTERRTMREEQRLKRNIRQRPQAKKITRFQYIP